MKSRRLRLIIGAGALAVLTATVIGISLTTSGAGSAGTDASGDAATQPPSATTPADGTGRSPLGGPDGGTDAPSPAPETPPPADSPVAEEDAAPEPATEIPPVLADEPAADTALPPSSPVPTLLSGPLPDSATAQNRVVDGFPAGIPLAARSTVATSDITVEDQRVRASLTASTPASGDEVLAGYDVAFAGYGFNPADAPAVGGSTARAYNRGAESVTVTVTPTDTGATGYTLLALLVATE